MKRYFMFLALTALMVFSFGLAQGAAEINLSGISPATGLGPDSIRMGVAYTFTFELTYTPGDGYMVGAFSNGYEVSRTDAGPFYALTWDTVAAFGWLGRLPGGNFFFNPFSITGTGADTIGYGGYSVGGGITDGTIGDAYTLTTGCDDSDVVLCIDSAFYPPGGSWWWATVKAGFPNMNYAPGWGGPYCYTVYSMPDNPPAFTNCVSNLSIDHAAVGTYTFNAVDPEGSTVTYTVVSGPGSINSSTGTWSGTVGLCDPPATLVIGATDLTGSGQTTTCTVSLISTNKAPTYGNCGLSNDVGMGNEACHTFTGVDPDGDPFWFIIQDIQPHAPVGTYSISPTTGKLCFQTATGVYPVGDGGETYVFTIGVTDGCDTTCGCTKDFVVLITEPYEIQIEKTHYAIQGQHEYVDVTLNLGSEDMGGFDLLLAYDRSALNFQTVIAGPLFDLCMYQGCGWEYFNFRTWFWPSYEPHFFWGGIVKVIGMAELNNGAFHPCCFMMLKPFALFTIDFLVTDNRLFECQFAPINWFWTDCGDNTISSVSGDTLFVSRYVYGFDLVGEISDMYTGYPTYTGVQQPCLIGGGVDKPAPVQFINFISGGVDIVCADSIDARGDINLNGIGHEIADAVVFTNYFIYGFAAFHINIQGQIAATDCNADGLALTVGDLVYLIRVVAGDAIPYSKLAPVEATYVVNKGVVTVDAEMGAALVVIEGNATPTLLADQMEMKYAYDADENVTRALVYSLAGNGFSGEFISAGGDVVSIELGSYEGSVVKATEVPHDYALNQNYPNPFNPTTTVSFTLPVAGEYDLTIYNVTGQVVTEFSGTSEAGTVSVEWNASDMASGIYFYKLNAGEFSATKKMVLLK
ncbi:MAG: T9SS type A sorting domain-containing protein [bacterium]